MTLLTPPSPIYKSSLRQSKLNNLPNPQQNPLASLSAAFIYSLFSCPLHATSVNSPSLDNFVAYAMYRTQLSADVCLAALVLLHRLKRRFPNATGSAGQRLYLAALMISSKVNNDDTVGVAYSYTGHITHTLLSSPTAHGISWQEVNSHSKKSTKWRESSLRTWDTKLPSTNVK